MFDPSHEFEIEIVDRCRENKKSYHVRINRNISKNVMMHILNKFANL